MLKDANSTMPQPKCLPPNRTCVTAVITPPSSQLLPQKTECISKPVICIIVLLVLGVGTAGLFGWLKTPGLNGQIKYLKEEVDLLSTELNQLELENARYESLNDQLNQNVADLEIITDNLNSTVTELIFDLNEVTDQLNMTSQDLQYKVTELAYENERYEQLNMDLTASTLQLEQDVEYFDNTLQDLVIENNVLSNLTQKLSNLTFDQNATLIELQEVLANFTAENDRLELLNIDIVSVVAFLNKTSLGFETSLEKFADILADQIVASQVLLVENLENSYRQSIDNWDCEYRDVFQELDWGNNFSLPITNLDSVIAYLEGRVFIELCWDTSDFEAFLNTKYPDGRITFYRLVNRVIKYASHSLEYYFPEQDEIGLTVKAWSDASFSCDNLANKYFWIK